MVIKSIIAIVALFLAAGCSWIGHNNMTKNNAPTGFTHASSISTDGTGKSVTTKPKLKMNQILENSPNRFNGNNNAASTGQRAHSAGDEQQVLQLVNQARAKAGLQPLSLNSGLSQAAMAKAQDMYNNNYFDHQSPTYGSPFDLLNSLGITYNAAAENIAKGQMSAPEVMGQWMNSPGHSKNIMNSSYKQIGIAHYNDEWVQIFTD
ncbi:CAP domain-containing protein [Paenibacillus sp. GCM10027626]|uniref:CAP domain-containing protein n=1 Tax=Paenibacillus sp. GCM10027626 TaxID=3273411 RepID=UPI00362B0877